MTDITLRDANQRFASLIREVEGGAEFVITRRGQPVARLSRIAGVARTLTPAQEAALARTLERMDAPRVAGRTQTISREELHDRQADREAFRTSDRD